jgi:hypothetical protein
MDTNDVPILNRCFSSVDVATSYDAGYTAGLIYSAKVCSVALAALLAFLFLTL